MLIEMTTSVARPLQTYNAGQQYDAHPTIANEFIGLGWAVRVEPEIETAAELTPLKQYARRGRAATIETR